MVVGMVVGCGRVAEGGKLQTLGHGVEGALVGFAVGEGLGLAPRDQLLLREFLGLHPKLV
jgi:hypothetical protein